MNNCSDPPLEVKDIPTGEWLCHSCRFIKTQNTTTIGASATTTTAVTATVVPQQRIKRSSSTPVGCKTQLQQLQIQQPPLKKTKFSPMELLIHAANSMNPKQFELPRSMSVPCLFPGTDKIDAPYTKNSRKSMKLQKDHDKKPDSTILLPARKCYECRKSCRIAPLISCDYCSLYYHLDCLDPPLTSPPSGRWMCPNHVEHYLDTKLLTSVSATERIKLWDRFNGYLDQDLIKLEFFRKISRKNPPFRYKIKLTSKNCCNVPKMIKEHYKKPIELLPSLKDILRLENYKQQQQQEEFVNNDIKLENFNNIDGKVQNLDKNNEILEEINDKNKENDGNSDNDQINDGNCIKNGCVKHDDTVILELSSEVESKLKQLDERILRLLAYQRIQHLLNQQQSSSSSSSSSINLNQYLSTNLQNKLKHMPMPSELLTPADIERISRVFSSTTTSSSGTNTTTTIFSPKKELFNNNNNGNSNNKTKCLLRARAMLCPVVSPHFYNIRTQEVDPNYVRHDDSFMGYRPTVSTRYPDAVAMRYRILNIGKGSTNDVNLERFGYCNNLSSRHATIFYDEFTNNYELINYSQYGSYVNNVLFANDPLIIERTRNGQKLDDKLAVPLEVQVREIIDKRRRVVRQPLLQQQQPQQQYKRNSYDYVKMIANDGIETFECCCTTSTSINGIYDMNNKTTGWEGPAILNHGSLLRFGCISFVFSIVDCAV